MEDSPEPRLRTLALFGIVLAVVITAIIVGAAIVAA